MDTTQKNREGAAQRRPRQETPQGAKRPRTAAPPVSAQQNNGAARTAQEQRQAAAGPRPRQEAADTAATPRQKTGQGTRRPAPRQGEKRPAPRQRGEAPARKRPPERVKAAPPKKSGPIKPNPDDISEKKRAYGKSKPKKKSAVAAMADAMRRSSEKKQKKKTSRPKQPTPAVIYTQPQAFNRNRLLTQLITVTAIVVALVLGVSIFFKVENVTVSGVNVYSEWAVREACGISEGDNLLTLSHARSAALIKANLPYVKSVRFGIKLPDTVNIMIEEEDVVYAIKDQDGTWWLMNSDGEIVEMGNNSKASDHTQVLGVALENPIVGQKGIPVEVTPTETDASGELVPVAVTGAQRFRAALEILKALEDNDIVGDAASVDVSRIEDIILWYGTRYQVNLGDSSRLDYKINCMNDVILQLSDFESGILDCSFNYWTDRVGYTPFA